MLGEILVAELSCRKSGRHVWRNWQGQNEEGAAPQRGGGRGSQLGGEEHQYHTASAGVGDGCVEPHQHAKRPKCLVAPESCEKLYQKVCRTLLLKLFAM